MTSDGKFVAAHVGIARALMPRERLRSGL
jgi:hypothetical protein